MIVSMAIIWGLVLVLGVITYQKGRGRTGEALAFARKQALIVIPRMPIALIAAGFIAELLPQEMMSVWLGRESGVTGILIAAALGALVPSGPIISFPVAIALMQLGAGVPQLVTFLTAWSAFAGHRTLMWEAPLMGWSFVSRRVAVVTPLPFVAAGIAALIGTVVDISTHY